MTLSDLQGSSSIASLFKCELSYSRAAVDKISADMERHMVHLRQLHFLYPVHSVHSVSCRTVCAVLVTANYFDNATITDLESVMLI